MISAKAGWIAASIIGIATLTIHYIIRRRRGSQRLKRLSRHHEEVLEGLEALIGNTPLVRINSLSDATGCEILGKAEFLNVAGSSKDRLALAVINEAESKGLIKPHSNDTIFEGTVGSTGISLATVAKAKGYKCHIVLPDDQAKEKYDILERLGAIVEKVRPVSIADANHFVRVAQKRCEDMNRKKSGPRGIFCDQFETDVNYHTHYHTTGPEIFQQSGGNIDAFVMGAGTGGTIAGVSAYLKQKLPNVLIYLADPEGSGLYNKVKHNVMYSTTEAEGTRRRHQVDSVVEGIGINRLTKNFAKACKGLVDDALKVSDQEAVAMSRYLLEKDGFFLGSSSAVHAVAAYRVAKKLGKGHTIVTLLCDHGSRHLTKFWSDAYLRNNGLSPDYKIIETEINSDSA
ncbi:hypothetical protein HDU76_008237 [Blyttiomyces sp. JEL0837]|nr:hypothetical protein HDU76_008237 [Blyttiomyces sp. JEL0837]